MQSLDEQTFISTAKQYAHQSNLNLVLQVGKQVYDFQSFQIIPFDSTGEDTIVMPSEGGLIADVEALREFPHDGFYPSEQTLMLRTSIQTSFHQTATFYLSVDLQPVGEASGVVFKLMPSEGGLIADVEALREFPHDGFYPSEQTLMLRTSIQTSFHQTATFYLSVDLQPVGEASGVVFKLLPYSIGASLLISLVASYFYARALTDPIRAICEQTHRMKQMQADAVGEASGVVFKLLPYSIGASLLISLVASYFYARALTDPIRAICEQTHRMKQMQADAYCQVDSENEIGELASNINRAF